MKRLICLFGELTRKPEFFGFSATKKKKKYFPAKKFDRWGRRSSVDSRSAPYIRRSQVQIPSTPSMLILTIYCSLYYIYQCIEKRTKIYKKRCR